MDYCEILVFSLNEKDYAVELNYVERIMGQIKVESIPEVEGFVEGVINYENETLTILNLLKLFGIECKSMINNDSRIIVLKDDVERLGIKVDAVKGVLQIKEAEIEKLPRIMANNQETKVKGLIKTNSTIKILLDVQKILEFQ
ncbi:MAG: chemotaxis protein CheW [Sarcina sp.]